MEHNNKYVVKNTATMLFLMYNNSERLIFH